MPLVLLTCLFPATALGQGRDPAGAEKLYDDGSKLLAANDWAGACAKFEQSFGLDAAPGTLLNLASCAEHDGKIALAWSRLKDARSLNLDTKSETRKKQIDSFVNAAIARLEPRLPYLTVKLKTATAAVAVTRDGQPTAVDVELPIDPGKHVIEASAAGFKPLKLEVVSVEGARETITLELEPLPAGEPPVEPKDPPVKPPPRDEPPPPPTEPSSGMSPLRIGGIVVGSFGVATLGVTIATGALALGKQSALDDLGCQELESGKLGCSAETADQAREISDDGATLALASTVTTFVGAGLVGAGVLMIVLGGNDAPDKAGLHVVPAVAPGHASLWLSGSF